MTNAATLRHDETLYAVLRASSSHEDSATQVCLIELTPEQIQEWRDRLARTKQMQTDHDVSYVAWMDGAPIWRRVNFEGEPLDEDGEIYPPAWGDDELRTEVDRVEVDGNGLDFTCFVKHSSERLNANLDQGDIDELEARLNGTEGSVTP